MDIENLFGKDIKPVVPDSDLRIAVSDQFSAMPLTYYLSSQKSLNLKIVKSDPTSCGKMLKEAEVDLATIPSIFLAQTKETWQILPGWSVTHFKKSKNALLFFKPGLREINKIAIQPGAEPYVSLLKILIQEKYSITPDYVQHGQDVESGFKIADAVLTFEDEAYRKQLTHANYIDLIEDWTDLTGLPFVAMLWAGRDFVGKNIINEVITSASLGMRNFEKICKRKAHNTDHGWPYYHDILTESFRYNLTDNDMEGLREFYQYAFFYGLIDYLPEIKFYQF